MGKVGASVPDAPGHYQPHQDHEQPRHRRASPTSGWRFQCHARRSSRLICVCQRCRAPGEKRRSSGSSTVSTVGLGWISLAFSSATLSQWQSLIEQPKWRGARDRVRLDRANRPRCTRCLGSSTRQILNIATVEDPVEAKVPGINQSQVNDKSRLLVLHRFTIHVAAGSGHHDGGRNP